MQISTARCIIRNFKADDAAQLYEVLSDKDVMKYIDPPFSREQTKDFIVTAGLCEPPLVYALIWNETDLIIGHVIFHHYEEDSFEIGWIIRKDFWGQGIAGEVTDALVKYARQAGAQSCIIECDPTQKVTAHIALKHNFVLERQDDGLSVYRLLL